MAYRTGGNEGEGIEKFLHKYIEKPERPRIFALALALHPQLGQHSPASVLPADGSIHQRILHFLCCDDENGRPYQHY